MRPPQVCDRCGGHFGLVTHRWWNNKFCKRTCKDAHLRELALGREQIPRWYGFLCGGSSAPRRQATTSPVLPRNTTGDERTVGQKFERHNIKPAMNGLAAFAAAASPSSRSADALLPLPRLAFH
jgi:hypothetical protein